MKLRSVALPEPPQHGEPMFFTEALISDLDERKGLWRLRAPLSYYSAVLSRVITVPQDFTTDFASVPRLPLMYLFFGGKGVKAAIIHDWLYSTRACTRAEADAVLKEALAATGYGSATQGAFWAGVRLGGWVPWGRDNVAQPEHVSAAMLEAA